MIAQRLSIVAGVFTAGLTDAVRRGAQVGTRSAQVLVELVGHFVEYFFQLRSGGPQEDDITGGAVHVGDAAAAKVPQIAETAQVFGSVEFSTGLIDAHGVKVGHTGKLLGLIAVPADDAAAVPENTDDAAVFPVGSAVLIGQFEHAQEVLDHILGDLKFNIFCIFCPYLGMLLQIRHEAGPGPAFELVQHRGFVFRH